MKIIESVAEMRDYSQRLKRDGKIVSFVGTDGGMHEGHMRLVEVAKNNSDVVILSTDNGVNYHSHTFNKGYDYKFFLNTFKNHDKDLCKSNGVDVLFRPDPKEYFPYGFNLNIEISDTVIARLKQKFQDNTIVNKICIQEYLQHFNIILPDVILLGQKDIFQTWTIEQLVKRLNFDIDVIAVPTVRDKDNVAYATRLLHSAPGGHIVTKVGHKKRIKCIYQVLQEVASWDDFPSIAKIKNYIEGKIIDNGGEVRYVVVCCPVTMVEFNDINLVQRPVAIVVSASFNHVMFCDNIITSLI
jgi:pantoate--beta-alanine ligase